MPRSGGVVMVTEPGTTLPSTSKSFTVTFSFTRVSRARSPTATGASFTGVTVMATVAGLLALTPSLAA